MFISPKFKLLLVHIPKTGGSSIRQMMKTQDPGSFQEGYYHAVLTKNIAEKYKDYYKIVVVRNSWELCASCYRFETQGVDKRPSFKRDITYKQWIAEQLNNKPPRYPYPRQLMYVTDGDTLLVDKICNYSNLKNDIEEVCNKVSMQNTITNYKAHDYGSYDFSQFYKSDEKQLIQDLCKQDIDYFGWEYKG